jgi:integrase
MKASASKRKRPAVKDRFRIVEFTNPSGEVVYRVAGTKPDGGRVRENWRTYAEAVGRKGELDIEAANIKSTITTRLKPTRLFDSQIKEAEQAFDRLKGQSLLSAVDYFLRNYREPVRRKLMADALAEFLAAKERENVRPRTLDNLRVRVSGFATEHADKLVSDILADYVRDFVFRGGRNPVSANNDRRALSSFFSWCQDRDYCGVNPCAKVRPAKADQGEPEVLTPDEASRVLHVTQHFKEGRLLPYITLALFAGVRPTELARLTWNDVDTSERTITITGKAAKLRQRRVVELPENAVEWLRPLAAVHAPICPANFRRDFDAVKVLSGFGNGTTLARLRRGEREGVNTSKPLREWTPDVLRHTAISYHLAKYQHEGKTATWAGNSPTIVQRHYKGVVTPKDAEAFWNLYPDPDAGANIVPLAAAKA